MKQFKRINKAEAEKLLAESQETVLVDIREGLDYAEDNDPRAIHLSNNNFNEFVMQTDKSIPIVVMCYHGISSQRVADYLSAQGFSDVYSLDGGYEAWSDKAEGLS